MIKYLLSLIVFTLVCLVVMAVLSKQPCRATFVGTYENIAQECECLGYEAAVEITQENIKAGGEVIGGEIDDLPIETFELTMCYGFISEKKLTY